MNALQCRWSHLVTVRHAILSYLVVGDVDEAVAAMQVSIQSDEITTTCDALSRNIEDWRVSDGNSSKHTACACAC